MYILSNKIPENRNTLIQYLSPIFNFNNYKNVFETFIVNCIHWKILRIYLRRRQVLCQQRTWNVQWRVRCCVHRGPCCLVYERLPFLSRTLSLQQLVDQAILITFNFSPYPLGSCIKVVCIRERVLMDGTFVWGGGGG